jgi:hypothetical protein
MTTHQVIGYAQITLTNRPDDQMLPRWYMDDTHQHNIYVIRIKGHLGPQWEARFAGMTITHTEAGETHLTGPLADQAALHGLLRTVRDSGLELLAVKRVDAE